MLFMFVDKYGFHWINFHKTTTCKYLLYQKWHKSVKKSRSNGWKIIYTIKGSMTVTVSICTERAFLNSFLYKSAILYIVNIW